MFFLLVLTGSLLIFYDRVGSLEVGHEQEH